MSEGGNNTIRNVMTLEVGQFDAALENTQRKLGKLDKGLDKTAEQAALLEGSLSKLFSNVGNINDQFGQLGKSLSTLLTGLNSNAKATATATRQTKQLSDESKNLSKSAEKAATATERLSDFTKKYNQNLESLNKTTKKGTEQQNKLKEAVQDFAKTKSTASKKAIKDSEKELRTSLRNNEKVLKDQRKSLSEINRMQREAELKLKQAQSEFDRRFFGKNRNSTSAKANELRSGIEAARQELSVVNAMRERVAGVVSGLEAKNVSLKHSLDLSVRQNQALEAQVALKARLKIAQDELNKSAREQLRIQRQQAGQRDLVGPLPATKAQIQQQKYYSNPKNFVGPYPAGHLNNVLSYSQQQKAIAAAVQAHLASANFVGPLPATKAQIQAQKYYSNPANFVGPLPGNHPNNVLSYGKQQQILAQQAKQQQQMHQQQMNNLHQQQRAQQQMHQQQMTFAKELAALYAGMKLTQASGSAVHLNSEYEQAQMRAKLWNLPKGEEDRFFQKSRELAQSEKYLSNAEATQIRIDAMSAVGYNNEKIIDATIKSAARNVHIMRAAGFENGTQSDLMKNLYGFAEARQVMYDPEEVIKSFDVLRRLSVVSGGKIKVADIETVARNIGDLRQTISAEGWLSIGALAEQFKTAGGGNGGGGGVATVGTMMKMMALYGSGRTITNRAAEQLLGADVLNVFDGDAAEAYKKNSAANKQFQKMIKNAGFKDIESMSEDPVRFFASLRGQLLDYMMGNFETFFGHDRKKHTYNAKGQMVLDGKIVDEKEQNKIEGAALKRFLATLGVSNKAVDGLALMMNKAFIERAEHVRDSAINGQSEAEALKAVQNTFKGAVENLQGEAAKLAESFAPLLPYLTQAVELFTALVSTLAQFTGENPAAAALIATTVAGGGLMLTLTALIGKFNMLRGVYTILTQVGKTGSMSTVAMATGAKTATSAYSTLGTVASGVLTTVSTQSGNAAGQVARNSQTIKQRIAGVGTSFVDMLRNAEPSVKGTIGLLGTLLKWAGWVALAGMAGWVIGKWISDIEVGGLKIGEHMQNLFVSISTGWDSLLNNLRLAWNTFLNAFGADNDKVLSEIRKTKREIAERDAMLRNKPAYQVENEKLQASAGKYWNMVKNAKNGDTIKIDGKDVKVDDNLKETARKLGVLAQAATDSYDYVNKDRRLKASLLPTQQDIGNSAGARALFNAFIKDKNAAIHGEDHSPQLKSDSIDERKLHATDTGLTNNYKDVPKVGALTNQPTTKPKKEHEEREWNNLFAASYQDIISRTAQKANLYEELGKAPDYQLNAMEEFKRKWAKGEFDDNNDPRSRKFAKGAYDKNKGWDAETQIDWTAVDPKSGISVMEWVDAEAKRARNDDRVKALKYAAERVGAGKENLYNALEDYKLGGDSNTTASEALRRQFARQEIRTPVAETDQAYQKYKRDALGYQTVSDYAEYAKNTLKINEEMQIDLLESEAERRRRSAEMAFNEEAKKIDNLRGQIDLQIKEYERLGDTSSEVYKAAVEAKAQMEKDLTERLELENQKRIRANEDAVQQMMRQWRDVGSAFESLTANWLDDAAGGITKLITGEMDPKDLDLKEWIAGMLDDSAGAMVKGAMGGLYKTAMGNANIIDMAKQLWNGEAVTGGGALTGWLNKIRGIENPVGDDTATLTGDAALNQNTLSLNSLRSTIQSLIGVMKGSPVEDVVAGVIGVDGAEAAGAAGEAGEAGSGGGFFSGLFSSIKTGFSNLFSSSGEGGIFSTIKNGFSNLFSEGGGLMGKIGGAFSSLFGSFGNVLGGLLGGGGGSMGKLGGVFSGAMQGFSSGGWAGALAGGISALFSAKGNAFGQSGHITAFAKGGAFTNGVFNQPTPFMFANGGAFGRLGVMGEAGPEAVMPLTRDSSGRLGVTANGFGGGMENTQNNVSIVINVSQEGGDSVQAAGDTNQNWKQMANSVRALVVEELAKQSRPGGINYKK